MHRAPRALQFRSGTDGDSALCDKQLLHTHFRQSFAVVKEQKRAWERAMEGSLPRLSTLLMLSEILSNCTTANIDGTITKLRFPDIKEKVVEMVIVELNDEKAALEYTVKTLKKIQNAVSNACQQALQAYNSALTEQSIEEVCRRSELYPSFAEMVEWITDIEQHFFNQVFFREFLLESMQFDRDFIAEQFASSWKNDSSMVEYVNDALSTLSFYMAANA